MRNTNDEYLPRQHHGQEQMWDDESQESKIGRNKVQQPERHEPPFLFGVGPDLTIPQIEDGSHKNEIHMKQQGQEEPTLYGQNQFKDNLGPVYAIPTVPWQQGHGQNQGNSQWQQGHGQSLGNNQDQQWGSHPQANMPCCGSDRPGYWHY